MTVLVTPMLPNTLLGDERMTDSLEPQEQFEKELCEWKEWRDENPKIWKILFKEEIDAETFAFYVLPNETKEKQKTVADAIHPSGNRKKTGFSSNKILNIIITS